MRAALRLFAFLFLLGNLFSFAAMNLCTALLAAMLLAWPEGRAEVRAAFRGRLGWALCAFAGWTLVSVLASPASWAPGASVSFRTPFKPLLAFVVGAGVARAVPEHRRVTLPVFAGVLGLFVLTVLPSFDGERINMSQSLWGKNFLGPNVFGATLTIVGLLAAGEALWGGLREARRRRTAVLASVALIFLGVGFTGSRSALIMAGISVLAFVAWDASPRRLAGTALGIGLFAGAAIMLSPRLLTDLENVTSSFRFRVNTWKRCVYVAKRRPLFGLGARRLDEGLDEFFPHHPCCPPSVPFPPLGDPPDYTRVGNPRDGHNDYLQMPAQLGFPGLALYLWLVFELLRTLRVAGLSAGGRGPGGLLRGAASALVGVLAYSFLNSSYFNKELGLIVWHWWGVAAGEASRVGEGAAPQGAAERSTQS